MHPSFVHIHDQNRDGYGAAGLDVHALLGDVLSVGWDWSCPNPIACELSPADVARVERFNLDLVRASEGGECALAPVEAGSVKFASLSASHTNAMLRLLAAGCPYKGTCADQVTVSGMLSMESLMKHDPQFHDAATLGLSWTVISQTVMNAYPGLASLIQEAANTGGQIQRKEGELQMARRLFNLWKSLKAGSQGQTDFSTIRSRILRSKPHCSASVPYIYQFLLKFGGGEDCRVLLETEEYVKAKGGSQRVLGPLFWDHVSQDTKNGAPLLRLRHACLRLAYVEEKALTAADPKRLVGMAAHPNTQKAEDLMQEVRTLVASIKLEDAFFWEVQKWEMDAVKVLLDKKGKFRSLEHAVSAAVVRIHEDLGGPLISEKWMAFRPEGHEEVSGTSKLSLSQLVLRLHFQLCRGLFKQKGCIYM